MWQEMDMHSNDVFKVSQKFKPNADGSDWGNAIFKLKAKKLGSDDPLVSAEGELVIAYFSGGQKLATKTLKVIVKN